jgi:precorrin-6Y C5,15-methyltransferase (decarboxylating)
LNVLLLLHDGGWRPASLFAPRPDEVYAHRRGLITKAEVRALSLSRLVIGETDIVWDIGAGSGAMSVEMAELAWRGQVFAVEHDPENLGYLHQNTQQFGALNVTIVPGRAPAALADLPEPAAIFIGGTGGEMETILNYIQQVARPGCRIMMNLATLENLHQALDLMQTFHWSPQIVQVNLAQGQAIAGLTRLAPLNPVFIVSGEVV